MVLSLAMVVSLMPLNCFIVYAGSGATLTNDQVIEKVIAVENDLKDSTGDSISDKFGSFSKFLQDYNINSFDAANAPTYILKSSSSSGGATCTVVFDEDTVVSVTFLASYFPFGGTTAVFTQEWVDITDQAQINAALTRLVGAYQDRDYPSYWFSISNGFSFNYCGKDAEFNRIAQKGNEYYLVIRDNGGLHGYTFIFDGDTMTNCYQVGIYPNSGIVSNYYQYPFIHKHTWSYAASGETLSYKSCQGQPLCAFTEEQSYSLTLSASSPNYYGSEATITIGTPTEKSAWTGAGLTVPTAISYEKSDGTSLDAAPTVVGSYVAKVNPVGVTASETNTAKVSFTIEK
ncbi:MAG: hypothetical protein MJ236_07180, partial [Clostridia bacterium]|nr:hypothetical protein [Clostridia bacterium]